MSMPSPSSLSADELEKMLECPAEEETTLRSWLRSLRDAGQLSPVQCEVDSKLEIGAITRVNLGLAGPALLFDNIKDYQDTISTRFVTCGMSNKVQLCLLLQLPAETSDAEIVRHLKQTYSNPIAPNVVEKAPHKENILKGDDIDLAQFPAPIWQGLDGGRYIDTFCGVITRDNTTGRENIGLYRGQVIDKNRIAKVMLATQGGGGHMTGYREKQEKMPVAIAYGGHDVVPFCAGSPFPRHVCKWDMMGAILGKPMDLVKCETIDLLVPAGAEIVVEGYINPDPATFEMEGPFGEYPGYYAGVPSPKPVLEVSCISYRNKPIMRGTLEGCRPGFPSEDSILCAYSWSAIFWNMLEAAGVVGVTDVWCPHVSTGTHIIVQIRKQYRGHAQQVAMALWGTSAAQWFFKHVIVVEEDIDIRDPLAVEWAIAFRVNAGMDQISMFGPTFGSPLDPSVSHDVLDMPRFRTGKWTRVLVDATRNWDLAKNDDWGGKSFPPVGNLEKELEQKIHDRWQEYDIGIDYLDEKKREYLVRES
ncbi:MAG: UbiD family decarboxylase [Gammaproteobacteria bacterium]|nr:UbiD family decarboxylase [Gammaproteobacteria bacterium]